MENSGVLSSAAAPLTWNDFLERMRHPSSIDFVKAIRSFVGSVLNNAPDAERDTVAVQQFFANMEAAFRAHSLWARSSEEELESAGEGLEKYVMTKLFTRMFASTPEDVKADELLYEKISLIQQFIRPENLDIKPVFQNEDSWLLAQKELQKINTYKAPRDKLVCILNCCKVISNLLLDASRASDEDHPGADDFLPVLIYVTIKANPPQLHSNLAYIERFRRQTHLVAEAAYFFTNMLSVESFIMNIDANALSMDESEFEKNMESAQTLLSSLSQSSGTQKQSDQNNEKYDNDRSPVNKTPSISDLENKGARMLLEENKTSQVFRDFPFLYSEAGDLTVSDVEELLGNYKQLVFKYVCLAKGLGVKTSSLSPTGVKIEKPVITRNDHSSDDVGNDITRVVDE
ncbi:hypothetical protein CASFOL_016301 [Castilleja foliolosa]|uniref:VPS9 domain-containing protein n=1 Tax=Castilleja foliolosa TaxID=1961234 RepID=A0ABD3DGI1_9LAMI